MNTNDLAGQGISLSRVGIFKMDNNGYLVDDKGNYVYGYTTGQDNNGNVEINEGTTLQPISLIRDAVTQGAITYSSATIGTDGTITVVDDQSIPHVVGKIAVAMVENTEGLEQSGGYTYNIGDNAGEVRVLGANKATGDILSGYLEMSNVDLATEMSYMITTQRGYQANTRMITVSDEMLEELVNMKR